MADERKAPLPPLKLIFWPAFGLALVLALSFAVFLFDREVRSMAPTDYYPVVDFELSDHQGGQLSSADLRGKFWVADFIFTNCAGTCPMMQSEMAKLQEALHKRLTPSELERVRLVSFSVDPRRDTVERLADYSKPYAPRKGFWYWVTGGEGEVQRVAREGFKLSAQPGGEGEEEIIHSDKLVLVDDQFVIRGYYTGTSGEARVLEKLIQDLRGALLEERWLGVRAAVIDVLPHLNACLNAIAGMLLICGFVAVKRGRIQTHKRFMIAAFVCSAVFLLSYLVHKYHVGTTHFREDLVVVRWIYLCILISHFLLAILVLPLAVTTIAFGLLDKIEKHRRLAKWTFPIWIYVSVTGVIVYLMLYQLFPPL